MLPPITVHCWSCDQTFATMTELSTHHLDTHERPWITDDRREPWVVTPRLERFRPPNYKAQAARSGTRQGRRPTAWPP